MRASQLASWARPCVFCRDSPRTRAKSSCFSLRRAPSGPLRCRENAPAAIHMPIWHNGRGGVGKYGTFSTVSRTATRGNWAGWIGTETDFAERRSRSRRRRGKIQTAGLVLTANRRAGCHNKSVRRFDKTDHEYIDSLESSTGTGRVPKPHPECVSSSLVAPWQWPGGTDAGGMDAAGRYYGG